MFSDINLTVTESSHEYTKNLAIELPKLLTHDYIAKSQAAHSEDLKRGLEEGEFLVIVGFSENYTFHVQNAIQARHWC